MDYVSINIFKCNPLFIVGQFKFILMSLALIHSHMDHAILYPACLWPLILTVRTLVPSTRPAFTVI